VEPARKLLDDDYDFQAEAKRTEEAKKASLFRLRTAGQHEECANPPSPKKVPEDTNHPSFYPLVLQRTMPDDPASRASW
jgi:hypothetical protein